MKKKMSIMGTGSRSMLTEPDVKEIYFNLEAEVLRLADKYDLHLISGMAEGWDEAIAKAAMRNGIPYTVMIPNKGYGNYYWGKNSLLKKNRMNVFNELVKHATKVVYVCDSIYEEIDGKEVHANFIRNQAMVDACDVALVYKPESRGTKDAVERLQKAKKRYKVAPFK
jgi:predicted Rossmann-fold nucleotide-binding protein